MCHCPFLPVTFWSELLSRDQQIAEEIRDAGCPHCGGRLHVANYPRKPRGEDRSVLGPAYARRLSFCCAREGCRRRTTPPSVRFLGRKVYPGAVVSVLGAGAEALSSPQRAALIEVLNLPPQTLHRWRRWWTDQVCATAWWRSLSGWFSPPIQPDHLPGGVLARLEGAGLGERLMRLLHLMSPLTTEKGARSSRVVIDTQKM